MGPVFTWSNAGYVFAALFVVFLIYVVVSVFRAMGEINEERRRR